MSPSSLYWDYYPVTLSSSSSHCNSFGFQRNLQGANLQISCRNLIKLAGTFYCLQWWPPGWATCTIALSISRVHLQTKLKYFGTSHSTCIILLWFVYWKKTLQMGHDESWHKIFALHHLVNIGWGNGLVPDGTKPLPEPMLTSGQSREISLNAISMEIFLISTTNIWKVYIYIFFSSFYPRVPKER